MMVIIKPTPKIIPHRIDDLEISWAFAVEELMIPHRIDDLESDTSFLPCHPCIPHRIDDLENGGFV